MPTKLVDFAEKERQANDTARNQARTALAGAQAALTDAQNALAKATGELAALEREARDIRQQLELIPTPADAEPLLAKLEANIIATSAKRAELLGSDEQLDVRRREIGRLQAELGQLNAAVQAATSRLAAEQRQAKVRDGWKESIGKPPLSTLRQDAAATLQSDPWKAAVANVRNTLTEPLFNRMLARGTEAAERVVRARTAARDAEDIVNGTRRAKAGTAGAAADSGARFGRAEAAVGQFVATGRQRLDLAIALFTPIAVPNATRLTPEEQKKVHDPDLADDRATALGKEAAVAGARANREVKLAAVGNAEMAALAKDPDANPDDDQGVKDAKQALEDADGALQEAEAGFTQEMRTLLDKWEAAVPDRIWRLAADFQQARVILFELGGPDPAKVIDPAKLVNDMDTAEGVHGDDLVAEAEAARSLVLLEARSGRRADQAAALTRTEPARVSGAVRGDQ